MVPDINALEPELERLTDDAAAGQDARVPPAPRQRRRPRRHRHRGVRRHPRGRQARHRPAPLRRPADGRRGPALRLGRRDEDRRGQDPRVDAAGLPQRARRQGRPPHHGQRLPGPLPRRVDGPHPPLPRPRGRPDHPRLQGRRRPRSGQQYAADITYGTNNEFGFDYLRDNMAGTLADKTQRGHNYAIVDEVDSILIDEARTPLIISRPRRRRRQALLPLRLDRPLAAARRRLRGRGGQARRRPARGRHRQGRGRARHREPLRRGAAEPRPPAARSR